jgi:predicted PurR-regulated permease PerM
MATYRASRRSPAWPVGRVMPSGAERQDRMGATAPPETTFQRAKPIALGLVLAVLAIVGLWLLVQLRYILVLVFVAVLFASAIARPAAKLERRGVSRGLAVVAVQLAVLVVMGVLFWIVVPPLVDQVALFSRDAPSYVTRFQHVRDEYLSVKRHYPEAATFDAQVADLGGKVASSVGGQLVNVPLTAAKLLFDLTMIYAIATLLVLRHERILAGFLVLVSPAHRGRTQDVMEKIWMRLGGYLRAKVIVMVCVGILMYIALRLLGIPFAVPLAVIVAFGELIPKIGVWIARIPLLTVAAFHGGWALGLAFLASYLIEDLKAYVISPRAEGHALNMDPLLTLLAVLCGTVLLGWQGALIAVPFAAMLQVLFEEVIIPWRTGSADGAEPPAEPPAEITV